MAEKKNEADAGKKARKKSSVLTVLATCWFAILSLIIIFPLFAGLLASFRPGKELIRRGLSIDLDISTMTLDNYIYLFPETWIPRNILCGLRTVWFLPLFLLWERCLSAIWWPMDCQCMNTR